MSNKTVIFDRVTMAVTDPVKSVPFKFNREGLAISGRLHVDHVAPGKHVTLDGDEAEYLLARFGGKEVDPATGAILREVTRSPTPVDRASFVGASA